MLLLACVDGNQVSIYSHLRLHGFFPQFMTDLDLGGQDILESLLPELKNTSVGRKKAKA